MPIREWWSRLRRARHEDVLDDRLRDEIAFHVEQQTAKNIRRGMAPADARRDALVRFGGVAAFTERTRDEFRLTALSDFIRDLRAGLRQLRRTPGSTATMVVTLALGIGASTAVFSVVENVLLRPLPYPEADRLVRLYQVSESGGRGNVSGLNAADWQQYTRSFEGIARMSSWGAVPVIGGAEPVLAPTTVISREFLDVMRVSPAIGRRFGPAELTVGGSPAAIVSHAFWRRSLESDPAPSSRTIRLGSVTYTVIGVMPEGFDYPNGTAVWLPRELTAPDTSRTAHNFQVVARLRDGVTLADAQADISQVSRDLHARYGDETWMFDAAAVPLLEQMTARARPTLQLLFSAALVLLVIANTNVSGLLVARAATRRHEFAVQMALGAGRGRLARQLVAEAVALCAVAGAAGTLAAAWSVRALVAMGPAGTPRLAEADVDWLAFAFAAGASVLSAGVLGLLTAVATRDTRLTLALTDGHRTGTPSRNSLLARQALVVTQVALTVVLLAGTGLLARSFLAVLAIDPGFRLDDALVVDLTVSGDPARRPADLDAILTRARALPGVSAVGLTSGFPLGGGNYADGQYLEMTSLDEIRSFADVEKLGAAVKERAGMAGYRLASGTYFDTMGIPLLSGRVFDEGDAEGGPHVAVVSESLARARWPDRDPIGRFIQFGNMDGDPRGFRVIGVVGDVRELTPEATPGPLLYASFRQRLNRIGRMSVIVRAADPEALAEPMRRIVRDVNPEQPMEWRTVSGAFDRAVGDRRFSLVLITAFGALALLLATLGLYALVAFMTVQRTREIGIRLALGATTGGLTMRLARTGAWLAGAGCLAGLAAALFLGRLVEGLLFGVAATDPKVLAAVALVTGVLAVAASVIPSLRATRGSPFSSLRAP